LRVREADQGDDITSCEALIYGETEDYNVNLVAVETCVAVTGLSAEAGTTSATLSWDDMGATKYRIAYGQVGVSSSITNVQTFGTSITLTGLVSGGTYSARVSRDCYPDGWSAYAQINWTNGMRLAQVEADVLVYPNPSNGNFRLQVNGYENTDMTVLITNAIGQVVYNSNIAVNETITVQDINLSDLAAGTYTLKLVNGDNVTTRNIVIE
jgi:Secretion system C-terminal sorting domain